MTDAQIIAELDRIEREMRDAADRAQSATKEAMRVIEGLMNDLGVQLHKEPA